MADARPIFQAGNVYTKAELAGHTLPLNYRDQAHKDALPDDSLWLCVARPWGGFYFDLVHDGIGELDPLVPAEEGAGHVRAMRARGMTFREIGRAAGVSTETAHRVASGHGRIRRSTLSAIETAAGT